ncbi:holo-[acyl-carrier-protein] synthase [Natranaerovirga hydrolytica]|uniref:Holo-[acyl-carrier-protein] synthase n=1 Tax=Natranaerovirga hydrolytica TaxID=680378 RepID=A0A4R1MLC3_9FIRM|nr:holo-[acyl-carrier-protein] synthase [Natranaerovirga hydrolytica]
MVIRVIKGIGTDIIEIERIEKAVNKVGFLEKYFTEAEQELFINRKGSISTIASNFAIKEATSKVFGTGFREVKLKEIEILRDELGKPYINVFGKAKEIKETLGIFSFHVTTSHNKNDVVAFVIGEGKNE